MNKPGYISLNGVLSESSEALVSPENRAMLYGDGCFETLKNYRGSFLGWEAHIERLQGGLNYLEMDAPVNSNKLKEEVLDLLDANGLRDEEAMVRIQFWRKGGRGYKSDIREASRMVQVHPYTPKPQPMELIAAKTRCIPSESLERKYKLTNGLNYIKAAQEANKHHKDDALMLTLHGYVSETTIANVFWINGDVFYTPSEECDLLPGITRNIMMDLIKDMGYKIEVGQFNPESFYKADAAFGTNSLIEIREILSVDGRTFKTGHKLITDLQKAFQTYKENVLTK